MADPAPNPTIDRALVQMKLVDLPEVVVAEVADTDLVEPAQSTEEENVVDAAEQGGESE